MPPVVDGRTAMSSCRIMRDQQVGYQLSHNAFVSPEKWIVVPDTNDVTSRHLSDARRTRRKSPRTRQGDSVKISSNLNGNDSSSGLLDNEVYILSYS